jgi:hypothetical protein
MQRIAIAVVIGLLTGSAWAEGKKVKVKGTLRTGVVTIGAETTGIVVQTKKWAYELAVGKDRKRRRKARQLDGKAVVVTGTPTVRPGVEVRERRIIAARTLKAADEEEAGRSQQELGRFFADDPAASPRVQAPADVGGFLDHPLQALRQQPGGVPAGMSPTQPANLLDVHPPPFPPAPPAGAKGQLVLHSKDVVGHAVPPGHRDPPCEGVEPLVTVLLVTRIAEGQPPGDLAK